MSSALLDEDRQQFRVLLEGDHYAIAKYTRKDSVYTITSTKVPEALQGKGYGKVMMEAVLSKIEALDGKVIPECSFVVSYLERNPQWQHLRVEN